MALLSGLNNAGFSFSSALSGLSSLTVGQLVNDPLGSVQGIVNKEAGAIISESLRKVPYVALAAEKVSQAAALIGLDISQISNLNGLFTDGVSGGLGFGGFMSEGGRGASKLPNLSTGKMAGMPTMEHKKRMAKHWSIEICRKNLFFVQVSSRLSGDQEMMNLLCIDVTYAPFTITGEKFKAGTGYGDVVLGAEPVELRLTMMDDDQGTVKRWFKKHAEAVTNQNGTVGLPGQYAISIKVTHGTAKNADSAFYTDKGIYRPANMEVNLSRTEDSFAELQLSFMQLDTFMRQE